MGLFTDLFSDQPAKEAAAAIKQGYATGLDQSNSTLTNAQGSADSLYGQAYSPFSSLIKTTGQGADAYADATGANGADGLARAKSLFTSTPGYQSGFDLLTDANDRLAASRGILASGNTIADTAKLATNYADQNYGNFVSRLAPYLGGSISAASGGANVLGSQAALDTGIAGQKATNQWNAATGSGQADANADLAKYSASGNFWNTLLGGANLALKASGIGGFAPAGKAA